MRALLVAALGVLAGTAAHAQTPVDPVTLDLVLDAEVPRGGRLTPDDFTVQSPGGPLPVRSVRLVQPAAELPLLPAIASDADERRVAASADRIVAVYVDEYHLANDQAFVEARRRLASFIRTALGPRDLVVVVKPLDSVVNLRLDVDRERAAVLIEGTQAREGDYTPRSPLERDLIAGTPARMDTTRRQVVVAGLNALAAHLGQFGGRKTLIVLSNTLPARAVPGRDAPAQTSIDAVVRAANMGAVAIYPIRPAPGPRGQGEPPDILEGLAQATTGFTMDDVRGLGAGLSRLLVDASRYYLLTIEPPAEATAAGFHRVEVAMRRTGVTVRARSGYAVRPIGTDRPEPRTRRMPDELRMPRHTSTLIRTWFGQAPAAGERTRVQFVWEPASRRAGDRAAQAPPARIAMRVAAVDGTVVFVGESTPSTAISLGDVSGPGPLVFESAPGQLVVQMDVLDLAGRVLDRDVRDITVTAFGASVAFGTPAVYRARSARDRRRLTAEDVVASPAAVRQFSRAEHLVVRVPLAAAADVAVTARLLTGFGSVVRPVDVTASPAHDRVAQVELPLAPLASATYVLEFAATVGGTPAVERLEFTVTP